MNIFFLSESNQSIIFLKVVVDGGGGSCRVCGVLRSNQLTIRQKTPAYQFYEPLLKDKVQMLLVDRTCVENFNIQHISPFLSNVFSYVTT